MILPLYSVYRRKLDHWKVDGNNVPKPYGGSTRTELVKDFDEAKLRHPFGKETGAACAFQPMVVLFVKSRVFWKKWGRSGSSA